MSNTPGRLWNREALRLLLPSVEIDPPDDRTRFFNHLVLLLLDVDARLDRIEAALRDRGWMT